ncbi:MAG: type I restriction-modification system subunit M [Candidatus Goldbacteria bacterium]|nr:type I restriction-modification system subunit M [Candidatus Goldiibacteriota bacterium]
MRKKSNNITIKKEQNGANLGFEEKLWKAADKLRSNMDAAEYKHIVLGLIFLKYVTDAFLEKHKELEKEDTDKFIVSEDRDEYAAANIFYVPKKARWHYIAENAKKPEIGKIIDEAMEALEKENVSLKGVLIKNYARETLNKQRLGELIDLIGTIGLWDKESKSKDILGRVYEYFLGQFADAEGKSGGQFYTPSCIVKLLVNMIEPYKGRVYDPCCGSGGMFVQSERFVEEHSGRRGDIAIYGQESNQTTWRLCKMNLAIRGIAGEIVWNDQGSFLKDAFPNLKADYILANPPFNDSDWSGELLRDDVRWKYGVPPVGNANFAWIQHFIHHLAPNGIAGFVMANGSMSSNTGGEGEIRKNIIEADLIDCMIALPSQLFYNTMIPACLWFITRDKKNNKYRNRVGETLFIDCRNMGVMRDRRHRELTDEEIKKIADIYHQWKSKNGKYKDIPGFCKAATIEDIRKNDYVLTPGRYVEIVKIEEDDEKFEEKMKRLTKELKEQFEESKKLEKEIRNNLKGLGYDL